MGHLLLMVQSILAALFGCAWLLAPQFMYGLFSTLSPHIPAIAMDMAQLIGVFLIGVAALSYAIHSTVNDEKVLRSVMGASALLCVLFVIVDTIAQLTGRWTVLGWHVHETFWNTHTHTHSDSWVACLCLCCVDRLNIGLMAGLGVAHIAAARNFSVAQRTSNDKRE